ncbi:hypothetical protein RJ55_06757 [Drechmeria coniospora]|nr:hypothetical protein RJ55_06757 [Drechmeria coniospora]
MACSTELRLTSGPEPWSADVPAASIARPWSRPVQGDRDCAVHRKLQPTAPRQEVWTGNGVTYGAGRVRVPVRCTRQAYLEAQGVEDVHSQAYAVRKCRRRARTFFLLARCSNSCKPSGLE